MKGFATYTLGAVLLFMSSCTSDPNSPGVEYMPDMYRSPSYEAYGENEMHGGKNQMEARLPVEGTVPRGWYTPYPYSDTEDDRALASVEVKSPLTAEQKKRAVEGYEDAKERKHAAGGKVAYDKFCAHCHGKQGKGDGAVVTKGQHPPPPSYSDAPLNAATEGQIYHAIMYGKNMMGSHASQIEEFDRWQIVAYVQSLQGNEAAAKESDNAAEGADGEGEAEAAADAETADAPTDENTDH